LKKWNSIKNWKSLTPVLHGMTGRGKELASQSIGTEQTQQNATHAYNIHTGTK